LVESDSSRGTTDPLGALTITRSQASDRVNALTLDGVSTTRTYNNFQEPLSEVTGLPGGGQYAETFARDVIGRIETKTETAPSGATTTYAYTYDPAGRLTEVTKNGNPYRAYSFEPTATAHQSPARTQKARPPNPRPTTLRTSRSPAEPLTLPTTPTASSRPRPIGAPARLRPTAIQRLAR
jgi:YD repeat-containing protein